MATALGRFPVVVLLLVIVIAAAGVVVGLSRQPQYTASMELNVGVPDASSQATPGYVTASQTLASSYGREAASDLVLAPLSRRRNLSLGETVSRVSATVVPNTPTLFVNATGSSAGSAIGLANAAGDELRSKINANVRLSSTALLLSQYRSLQRQANGMFSHAGALRGMRRVGVPGISQARIDAAQLRAQVAELRAQSVANHYSQTVSQGTLNLNLAVLNRASSAQNNRTSTTERYGVVGALAGVVLGAVVAFLIARVQARRRTAAR